MDEIIIPKFYDKESEDFISIPTFLNSDNSTEEIPIPNFLNGNNIGLMSCDNRCMAGCLDYCETNAELGGCTKTCEGCQSTCEKSCQGACLKSNQCGNCEDGCEDACQSYCENWCMCVRQSNQGCLDECEDHCMNCEGACMDACLSTCEGCLACETACEYGCESTCMKSCQDYCEDNCENCEGACLDYCESNEQVTPPNSPSYLTLSDATTEGVTLTWGLVSNAERYYMYVNGSFWVNVKHPTNTYRIECVFEPNVEHTICIAAAIGTTYSVERCNTFTVVSPRPDNWYWDTSTSSSGNTLYVMPASKWNQFTARVDLFRDYVGGLYVYPFTTVTPQRQLSKTIYNEAVHAINEMVSTDKLPLLTSSIRIPEDLKLLRRRLNSIP